MYFMWYLYCDFYAMYLCAQFTTFYDVVKLPTISPLRTICLSLGSSHRQSCPSRSVAWSQAKALSTLCTEPVPTQLAFLWLHSKPAVPVRHRSVWLYTLLWCDSLSGSALEIPLSQPQSLSERRTAFVLSCLEWRLGPSVPSLTTVSPRWVLQVWFVTTTLTLSCRSTQTFPSPIFSDQAPGRVKSEVGLVDVLPVITM